MSETANPVSSPGGRAAVPVTRILAIGTLTEKGKAEARGELMPKEIRATVQLFLDSKIVQWFSLVEEPGVAFLLDVTSKDEAHDLLINLPLGQAGFMSFNLIPLGPLQPLRLLLPMPDTH